MENNKLKRAKYKRINVYVSPIQHKELKIFCAKLNMSMSNFVNYAIREKIQKELSIIKNGQISL